MKLTRSFDDHESVFEIHGYHAEDCDCSEKWSVADIKFVRVVAIKDGYEIQCDECENYVSGFYPTELPAQYAADLHREWHGWDA